MPKSSHPYPSASPERIDRARGCFVGLAVGDALGRPTEGKSYAQIQERWGYVSDFLDDDPGGSDDTEYAVFSAQTLLQYGRDLTPADVAEAWRAHITPQQGGFKGAGFSEMLAIENLRAGLEPPATGQHLHSWSDGLAMRVAPFGIAAAGDSVGAADLAETDGVVSHAGEGVLSGRAVAAAIAKAIILPSSASTVAAVEAATEAALSVIPAESWTASAIMQAVEIGRAAPSTRESLGPLASAIVCDYYPWADLGPEAVGLAFGLMAAARGDFSEAVLGGVNIGRDTDTIAAIAGSILGAYIGYGRIPEAWRSRVQVTEGRCIRVVAGADLLTLADDLAHLA